VPPPRGQRIGNRTVHNLAMIQIGRMRVMIKQKIKNKNKGKYFSFQTPSLQPSHQYKRIFLTRDRLTTLYPAGSKRDYATRVNKRHDPSQQIESLKAINRMIRVTGFRRHRTIPPANNSFRVSNHHRRRIFVNNSITNAPIEK